MAIVLFHFSNLAISSSSVLISAFLFLILFWSLSNGSTFSPINSLSLAYLQLFVHLFQGSRLKCELSSSSNEDTSTFSE